MAGQCPECEALNGTHSWDCGSSPKAIAKRKRDPTTKEGQKALMKRVTKLEAQVRRLIELTGGEE